jgi:hypothetical protein
VTVLADEHKLDEPKVNEPKSKAKAKPAGTPAPALALKKRLIVSLGDKGGVGKSFIIRKLAEMHMEARTANLLLVDGDASVSSIYKFHTDTVVPFDLHGTVDARDQFVNDLLRRGNDFVIADLPAASLSTLREMASEYSFAEEVAKAGYRMTVISPITPYDDPLLDFQEAVSLIDPDAFAAYDAAAGKDPAPAPTDLRADYLAIVNLVSGERSDFEEWDAPGGFTKGLLHFVGGVEVEIPLLRPKVAAALQLHRLSFKGGETSERLAITDRSRLQRWNAAVEATLRGVGERLGF